MPIKVGDRLPAMKLMTPTPDGPRAIATDEVFGGKKVVLFGVPGAFTPACSERHLPGFLQNAEAFAARGVDRIACLSVNDAFVLDAWGRDQGVNGRVTLLADGSATFTQALGLELDLRARGMGVRCQRFALVAEDGVVKTLAVEQPGGFDVSRAEAMLEAV